MGEDDALDANEILSDALVILQLCHTFRRVLALSNRLRVETHLLLQVIATVVEGGLDFHLCHDSQWCVESVPDASEDDGACPILNGLAWFPVNAELIDQFLSVLIHCLELDFIGYGRNAQDLMALLVILKEPEFAFGLSRCHRLHLILGFINRVPWRGVDHLFKAESIAQMVGHVVLLDIALDVGGVDGQSHLETTDWEVGLDYPAVLVGGFDVERVITVFSWLQFVLEVGTVLVLFQHGEPEVFLLLHLHVVGLLLHRKCHFRVLSKSKNHER